MDHWIATKIFWFQKQLLCQLSHSDCPIFFQRTLLKSHYKFFLKKWANPCLFLSIFVLFSLKFQYKLKKAQKVCLGFEPGTAEWQAQTKPRSYGGHPKPLQVLYTKIKPLSRRKKPNCQYFSLNELFERVPWVLLPV